MIAPTPIPMILEVDLFPTPSSSRIPANVSANPPTNPITATVNITNGSNLYKKYAVVPIASAPMNDMSVPKREIAPDTPGETRLKFFKDIGFPESTPNSEPNLSADAAARAHMYIDSNTFIPVNAYITTHNTGTRPLDMTFCHPLSCSYKPLARFSICLYFVTITLITKNIKSNIKFCNAYSFEHIIIANPTINAAIVPRKSSRSARIQPRIVKQLMTFYLIYSICLSYIFYLTSI